MPAKTKPKVKVSTKSFKPKVRPMAKQPSPDNHPCETPNCKSNDDTYQDTVGRWWCGFCLLEEHDQGLSEDAIFAADLDGQEEVDDRFGCGCKMAGIGIFNDNHEIQRCDDCALFETDDDAANAVEHLIKLLYKEYSEHGGTVADAADRLADLQARGVTEDEKVCREDYAIDHMLTDDLAREFSKRLRVHLNPRQMLLVIRENRRRTDGTCASHDFCDANMAMLEAWEKLTNMRGPPRSEVGRQKWESAWALARATEFNVEG